MGPVWSFINTWIAVVICIVYYHNICQPNCTVFYKSNLEFPGKFPALGPVFFIDESTDVDTAVSWSSRYKGPVCKEPCTQWTLPFITRPTWRCEFQRQSILLCPCSSQKILTNAKKGGGSKYCNQLFFTCEKISWEPRRHEYFSSRTKLYW
jgi:hypothetical protein